jgi:NADH dehydrogenase (ubiquinone) flavoprotein 2
MTTTGRVAGGGARWLARLAERAAHQQQATTTATTPTSALPLLLAQRGARGGPASTSAPSSSSSSSTSLFSSLARAAAAVNGGSSGAATTTTTAPQRSFATNSHDLFNVHRESPENNPSTEFAFTPANLARAQNIIARYPPNYKASAVIPVLDLAQQQNDGWLSLAAMNSVAKLLEMPEIRVYEVATFYTMFNRSRIGKYHVMVCGTTPCRLQGAQGIEKALSEHLGVHMGETTADGLFTLGEMECMGACVNAPMIAVADYTKGAEGFSYLYYEDLTPEDAKGIVDALKAGKTPKAGSQHRSKAEPAGAVVGGKWVPSPGGTQTLMGTPRGPYCRDLDAVPGPAA